MVREQGILEERIWLEREGEMERVKEKGKTPAIQMEDSILASVKDPNEEITQFKE